MNKIKFANCDCVVEPGKFDVNKIPTNCPATFALISSGFTTGVFQLESRLGMDWAKKVKPQNIEEVAALTAIVRPGSLEAGQSDEYVDIKFGRKQPTYLHPALKNILSSTYNSMIYQEQVLAIAKEIAGFSMVEADNLRKAVGKKIPELMASLKQKFVDGALNNKVKKEVAEQIFDWIEKSQRYSFNRSHAIAYGILSYNSAWMKCHFPLEFFTSYLTYSNYKSDTMDEIYRLVQDARLFGIEILQPDIKECNIKFKIIDDKIKFGLSNIKGVGESAVEKIIKNGPECLSTWQGFIKSIPILHKNVGVELIKSGACDSYNKSRSQMIKELECIFGTQIKDENGKTKDIKGLTERERKWFFYKLDNTKTIKDVFIEMTSKVNEMSARSLSGMNKSDIIEFTKEFTGLIDEELSGKTKFDIINLLKKYGYESAKENKPFSNSKRIEVIKEKIKELDEECVDTNLGKATAEKYFLGISLSCSPADDAEDECASHTCLDLAKALNGEDFSVCAVIDAIKTTKTKRGKNIGATMCFLTISDSTYSIDHAVIFPDAYEKLNKYCKDGLVCLIQGYKKNGSIIIQNIRKLI
jgi:DNA polymerase III alpha subunit